MLGGIDLKSQPKLADVEWLRQLQWRSDSSFKAQREAAASGDKTAFVLATRAALQPMADRVTKRLGAQPYRLLTASRPRLADVPAGVFGDFEDLQGERAGETLRQLLRLWPMSTRQITWFDSLVNLHLLMVPPVDTEVETWLRLWRLVCLHIATETRRTRPSRLEAALAAEARFLGSLVFAALEGSEKLREASRRTINATLLEVTDTDGTPAAEVAWDIRFWLGTFARIATWARAFKVSVFDNEATDRYKVFVQRAIELSSGEQFAFEPTKRDETGLLLKLAAKTAGWSSKTKVGGLARGKSAKRDKKSDRQENFPAVQSDWAEFAYCRNHYAGDADLLSVTHNSSGTRLSLHCLSTALLSGNWQTTLMVGEKKIAATGKWDCTCWHSDKDGDYIELQWRRQRCQIDRQIFLSRTEHFAILTDSVNGKRASPLAVEMTLPLAKGVMARADFVSREFRLHTGDVPVRAFPVSLDFDRVHHALGDLTVENDELHYRVTGEQATQAALILDWHPKRRTSDSDWRPLTVTEDRNTLTSAQAAAFLLRVGKHQVVSYRSLDGSGSLRSFLGNHSDHETVIAEFGKDGLHPLLLVDQ